MKILNYGAGAVGLGLDSCLLKSGSDVTIIARPSTAASLKRHGLIRNGIFGAYRARAAAFTCYSSLKDLSGPPYDFILVSTKSFDSYDAAKDLSKNPFLSHSQTKIILCQNGWGNAEKFLEFFPPEKIYNARIITGFTRSKPHQVTITVHASAIHIGSLYKADLSALTPLCEKITAGGITCRTAPDISKDLWAKMLYNCALNPLGAIFDAPYGELGLRQSSQILMNNIIEEIYHVMAAAGHQTHWLTAKDYLTIFYEKLLPATAQHRSSTLQDIKAGKKTEIDALNGAIIKIAESHNIPCPINTSVYQMIKFIEERQKKKTGH